MQQPHQCDRNRASCELHGTTVPKCLSGFESGILWKFLESDILPVIKYIITWNNRNLGMHVIQADLTDLIITNKPKSYQNTVDFSIGLWGFHKMILASMNTTFPTHKPLIYRNMKHFDKFLKKAWRHLMYLIMTVLKISSKMF